MQYTIRGIPQDVDSAIRARARAEHKSLNQVIVEALRRGLSLEMPLQKKRDLADLCGSWVEDPQFDRAIVEVDQVGS